MNNEDIVRDFIQRRMPSPPTTGTVALVALNNLVAERDAWKVAAIHHSTKSTQLKQEQNDLLNEVDCRIEHGAESGGHLEYVRTRLLRCQEGNDVPA